MGKTVKKLVNKVTKVATFGIADADQVFDAFTLGQGRGISDQFLGTDLTGAKAAASDMDAQNAQRERQAQTFAQNMSVDLGSSNVANVDLGGTADAASTGNRRKKRPGAQSASSSLGINY